MDKDWIDGAELQTIDVEQLRRWVDSCDPRSPIDVTDDRYFDLDEVTIDGEEVPLRGADHVQGLRDAVELSPARQSCQLFSGYSGTGKSTELRRLAQRLEAEGFSVLIADAEEYLSLSRPLNLEDLLVIVAGAFGEATSARIGEDVLKEGYWSRFADFLRRDVDLGDFKLPGGVVDFKVSIKDAIPFWAQLRGAVARSRGKLREHSHDFVRHCVTRLEKNEPRSRGVVFILDSLERLSPILPTQFGEVMASVAQVFKDDASYLRLPGCHVIYTIPPYARLVQPELGNLYDSVTHILPAIKVTERTKPYETYRPGVEALVELVGRRIPITEVFGERRDLLEDLVAYSGGHVRTLLTFVRDLLRRSLRGGLPPTRKMVEEVVQYFREPARTRVFQEDVPVLWKILQQGAVEDFSKAEHAVLASLMNDYLVLCYRNGHGWFEVHPLVRDLVEKLALRRGLEGSS